MGHGNNIGLPGVSTGKTATPRKVLITDQGKLLVPGGKIIDGSLSRDIGNTNDKDVLRAGVVMGKVTSSGKYAPSILGSLDAAHNSSGTTLTTLTVSTALALEIQRRIGGSGTFNLVGPPSAAGVVATTVVTYSAINTSTGIITITDIAVNKIAGSFIMDTDGTEEPLALIADDRDTYGIKVTDSDDQDVDVPFPQPVIGGFVDVSQLIEWPSDTALQNWLIAKLNNSDDLTVRGRAPFQSDDVY